MIRIECDLFEGFSGRLKQQIVASVLVDLEQGLELEYRLGINLLEEIMQEEAI